MFGKIGKAIGKYSGASLAVKGAKKLGAPTTAALVAPTTLGVGLLSAGGGKDAAASSLKERRQQRIANIQQRKKLKS